MAPELCCDEDYTERLTRRLWNVRPGDGHGRVPYSECGQTLHRFTRKSRRQRTHRPRPDFVHAPRERVMCAQRTMPASLQTIVDEKTKGFIELCLQHEHQHRPSASQVFTHEYLQPPFNDPDDDQPVELRPAADAQILCDFSCAAAAAPLPAIATARGLPSTAAVQFGSAFAAAHRCRIGYPRLVVCLSWAATTMSQGGIRWRENTTPRGHQQRAVARARSRSARRLTLKTKGEPLTSSPSQPLGACTCHSAEANSVRTRKRKWSSPARLQYWERRRSAVSHGLGKDTPEQVAEEMVEELGLELHGRNAG